MENMYQNSQIQRMLKGVPDIHIHSISGHENKVAVQFPTVALVLFSETAQTALYACYLVPKKGVAFFGKDEKAEFADYAAMFTEGTEYAMRHINFSPLGMALDMKANDRSTRLNSVNVMRPHSTHLMKEDHSNGAVHLSVAEMDKTFDQIKKTGSNTRGLLQFGLMVHRADYPDEVVLKDHIDTFNPRHAKWVLTRLTVVDARVESPMLRQLQPVCDQWECDGPDIDETDSDSVPDGILDRSTVACRDPTASRQVDSCVPVSVKMCTYDRSNLIKIVLGITKCEVIKDTYSAKEVYERAIHILNDVPRRVIHI